VWKQGFILMGIHYRNWEERVIEIEKKKVARLIPVAERRQSLLGPDVSSSFVGFKAEPRQRTPV